NRLSALPEPTNSAQLCVEPGALSVDSREPIHESLFINGLLARQQQCAKY
ncbi:MAG: hypothetical protein ACI841_004817, partial [Planctomycetota bacterium]